MKRSIHQLAIIFTLIFILIGFLLINKLKEESDLETNIAINKKLQIEQQEKNIETTIETTTVQEIIDFKSILASSNNSSSLVKEITNLIEQQYNESYLDAKPDIIEAANEKNLDIEESSYLFLPTNPAEYTKTEAKQIDIPLLLQKNQAWRKLSYGTNTTNQLGENGCAIVSLAMIDSYYQNKIVEPKEILNWSSNDYYIHNEGTSWQIFYDFAIEHEYNFENFGSDFYRAMEAVNQGKVVVVSVKPGHFTEVGHILLIRGYSSSDKKVFVNDPNDNAEKMYSLQGIDENILLEDALNFWTLYK